LAFPAHRAKRFRYHRQRFWNGPMVSQQALEAREPFFGLSTNHQGTASAADFHAINTRRLSWQLIARPGLTVKSRATLGASPIAQSRSLGLARHSNHGQSAAALAACFATKTRGKKRDRHECDT
jgi:hypothetical protein